MSRKSPNKYISYEITGMGKPIVLIHGLGASRQDWNLLIPQLASAGYQCISLDLVGHGESDKPLDRGYYHIENIYTQLINWLDTHQIYEPATFIGHSMGGFLSLLIALRRPSLVGSLALIDPLYSPIQLPPFTHFIQKYPEVSAKAMELAPEWLIYTLAGFDPTTSKFFDEKKRRRVANDYKRASPNIFYLTQSFFDLQPSLTEIEKPTLILWGDSDRTLLPDTFPKLVSALPFASSRMIPGAGHQPHLSHPERISREVLMFLKHLDRTSQLSKMNPHTFQFYKSNPSYTQEL